MFQDGLEDRRELDSLTGLPNMMGFRHLASEAMADPVARKDGLTFAFLNLENFRSYNEKYGFEGGDKLLAVVATELARTFSGYHVARFSGDHFVVLLRGVSLAHASRMMHEAHEAVWKLSSDMVIELKCGIYLLDDDVTSEQVAYDRAKVACDKIARKSDVCLRVFDEQDRREIELRTYVINNFERALAQDHIKVFFQPQLRTVTGRLCGAEALARWEDPVYGLMAPGMFVGVLEESHLIHKLDLFVVEKVCQTWRSFPSDARPEVPVSVNLSRLDFSLCDVFSEVERCVRAAGMPRQMLNLEVTESALNDDPGRLKADIVRFRSCGYQVWLDDFGSDFSSFSSLKDYEFDVVKADLGFLRSFETNPRSRIIISSIVDMAKRLGMQTLVEGVETQEQYDFLKSVGCEFMQGYLVGKPVPLDELMARIQSGDLELERFDSRGYYDSLGRVNVLSSSPLATIVQPADHASHGREDIAIAVLEMGAQGDIRCLNASTGFMRFLNSVGLGDLATAERSLNNLSRFQSRSVHSLLEHARTTGETESVDLFERGYHYSVRARLITTCQGSEAYLVSLVGAAEHLTHERDEVRAGVVEGILECYDRVDMLDLRTGSILNVICNSSGLTSDGLVYTSVEELFSAISQGVHPSDRVVLHEAFDIKTLPQRLSSSPEGRLFVPVRFISSTGGFAWKTCGIIALPDDERAIVLVRDIHPDLQVHFGFEDELPIASLWRGLLATVPAGVYWKDADLCIAGMNAWLANFFGIDSLDEVLGKRVREMGRLVDNDAFSAFERRTLAMNEIHDTTGAVISKGTLRQMRVREITLRKDGIIAGVLGVVQEAARGDDDMVDSITRLPNMRGLMHAMGAFEDAYAFRGRDFSLVCVSIDNIADVNAVYGETFGDRVLEAVVRSLVTVFGREGVVARLGGCEFGIMRQVNGKGGLEVELTAVSAALSASQEVDGRFISLTFSVGGALYGEARGFEPLKAAAEERMFEDRYGERQRDLANVEKMSTEDAAHRIKDLESYFDQVRLVDASRTVARRLDRERGKLGEGYCCFDIWGNGRRCVNCISARTVATHSSHAKYEMAGGRAFYITTQYVEVDGQPRVIEMVRAIGDEEFEERGVRELHDSMVRRDVERYIDAETGAFSRMYFDEMLSALRGDKVAALCVSAENPKVASADICCVISDTVRSCVRTRDLVIRFDEGAFIVAFDHSMPSTVFSRRLESIIGVLQEALDEKFPDGGLKVHLGAVDHAGYMSDLAREAGSAMSKAMSEGERFRLTRG